MTDTHALGSIVKTLEWGEAIHGGWVALGAAGVYHVHRNIDDDLTEWFDFTHPFNHDPNIFATEDEAKSAAQRHYAAKVIAAVSPDYLERVRAMEAEIARLREVLGDLLTWFPDEPSPPEWRLKGGANGADDAVEAARAALSNREDGDV